MRKFFLLTLALLWINAANLFDTENFFVEENFADASRAYWQGEVTVTENFPEEVLHFVNIEREKAGLKPLKMSPQLTKSAEVRAKEIPTKFSHTRPNGKPCFTAVKISYRFIGENIAAGQRSPQAVVEAWMNSPGHRENILNPKFHKIGVGYLNLPDSDYKHYWVQLFKD